MTVPVRRFERGASVDFMSEFMHECGYEITAYGGFVYRIKRVGERGNGKRMTRSQIIAILDRERMARGLEPILKRLS